MGLNFFPKIRAISAVASALIVCALLPFPVRALKASEPLTKSQVLGLLKGKVTPTRVGEIARERGVAFALTPDTEGELRTAGATDELLNTLRQLAPRTPPPPPPPANNPPASPVLTIESSPGGAEVYVDDERVGTTSPEGRLKLSHLAPGQHVVRVSHGGYRDSEKTVNLTAGQTTNVTSSLETVKAPPQPSGPGPGGTPSGPTPTPPPNPGGSGSSLEDLLGRSRSTTTTPGANVNFTYFNVAHDHGSGMTPPNFCVGVLAIGNGMIHYRSTTGVDPLDIPLREIKEAKKNGMYLVALGGFHIKLERGKNYNFVVINQQGRYLPPDNLLNAIHTAKGD